MYGALVIHENSFIIIDNDLIAGFRCAKSGSGSRKFPLWTIGSYIAMFGKLDETESNKVLLVVVT